jgi:hypothetical protein
MSVRSHLVDKRGRVWVYSDDHKVKRQVAPGWEKWWIVENVYGWSWIGPFRMPLYVHLLVLPYEPEADERRRIEARFEKVPPPFGESEIEDPFALRRVK